MTVFIQVLGRNVTQTCVCVCILEFLCKCLSVFVKRRQEVAQLWLLFHRQPCAICDSHCMNVLFFLGGWSAPVESTIDFRIALWVWIKCVIQNRSTNWERVLSQQRKCRSTWTRRRFLYDKVCEDVSAHKHTLQIYVQTRRICVSG